MSMVLALYDVHESRELAAGAGVAEKYGQVTDEHSCASLDCSFFVCVWGSCVLLGAKIIDA